MRKSNSKAFKALVKEYYNTIVTTPEEQEELAEAFWSYWATHKNIETNYYQAFENFVNSCSTNFDFETEGQRELLKSWYGENMSETSKYQDYEISHYFCYHIYREFERRQNAA